jgi:toxin ParE1/3/4
VPRTQREPKAAADLEDIWFYIATDNVEAAERVIRQIYEAEDRLAAFPESGRTRPELGSDIKSWAVGSYIIFYRIGPSAVEILRILHGARDLGEVFSEP